MSDTVGQLKAHNITVDDLQLLRDAVTARMSWRDDNKLYAQLYHIRLELTNIIQEGLQ